MSSLSDYFKNWFTTTVKDKTFVFDELKEVPEGTGEFISYRKHVEGNLLKRNNHQLIVIKTPDGMYHEIDIIGTNKLIINKDVRYDSTYWQRVYTTSEETKPFNITDNDKNTGTVTCNIKYIEDGYYRLILTITNTNNLNGKYYSIFYGKDMDTFNYVTNIINYIA